MGRRTGRSAAVWRGVVRITAVGAALCAPSAALPGPAAVAAPDPTAYAFAADARTVPAATGTTGAGLLEPGAAYRSSLRVEGTDEDPGQGPSEDEGAKAYFRLELDDVSNVYVAVTAIPRAGSVLSAGEGISVSLQDADSASCSHDSATVGASKSPQPVTAWGARELLPGKGVCKGSGTYYVVVEHTGRHTGTGTETGTGTGASTGTTSGESESWDLEIAPVSEPSLRKAGATSVPEDWNSATPTPPAGRPEAVRGGAGFARATAVRQGAWSDEIAPGQTLFYKVPVDWGQQVSASVDLGSADKDSGYVVDALDMTLYNPVRAKVNEASVGYGGSQKSAALPPVPPVRYVNRYAPTNPAKSLRFAGAHYLVVHLAAQVGERFGAGPYGLTLRVRVGGRTEAAPGYAGRSAPRGFFDVGAPDPELAAGTGPSGGAAGGGTASGGGGPAMKAVAVGGIGAGSVLLSVLGVWTLTARRRSAAQIRASAQNPTA